MKPLLLRSIGIQALSSDGQEPTSRESMRHNIGLADGVLIFEDRQINHDTVCNFFEESWQDSLGGPMYWCGTLVAGIGPGNPGSKAAPKTLSGYIGLSPRTNL